MESDLYLVYNILSLLNGNDLEKRKSAETELEKLKKNQNLFTTPEFSLRFHKFLRNNCVFLAFSIGSHATPLSS